MVNLIKSNKHKTILFIDINEKSKGRGMKLIMHKINMIDPIKYWHNVNEGVGIRKHGSSQPKNTLLTN